MKAAKEGRCKAKLRTVTSVYHQKVIADVADIEANLGGVSPQIE